jgi:hypothetical protein
MGGGARPKLRRGIGNPDAGEGQIVGHPRPGHHEARRACPLS